MGKPPSTYKNLLSGSSIVEVNIAFIIILRLMKTARPLPYRLRIGTFLVKIAATPMRSAHKKLPKEILLKKKDCTHYGVEKAYPRPLPEGQAVRFLHVLKHHDERIPAYTRNT